MVQNEHRKQVGSSFLHKSRKLDFAFIQFAKAEEDSLRMAELKQEYERLKVNLA